MNNTNVSYPFTLCDVMVEMALTLQTENLAHSIVFDLIAGVVSTIIVYKFYQGVEIDHPIYAIIFTNIVLSTFISFVSFLCTIFGIIVVSCIPFFIRFLGIQIECV